jgi:hypothetical protein
MCWVLYANVRFTHDIDDPECVHDGLHYFFWDVRQLVVLQIQGLQRVEIVESQRRYDFDTERTIMLLESKTTFKTQRKSTSG